MEWYHMTLIAAALIASLLAWGVPRASMWIAFGAASYVSSAMWHNLGMPYATQFGAATNLIICYLFWHVAEQKWEMRLWNFFHLMLLIDLAYIFRDILGGVPDRYTFAVSLEIVNLAALIFVGGVGIAERMDGVRLGHPHLGRPGRIHRGLWAERSANSRPPWQK